jgi:hypothetical protein
MPLGCRPANVAAGSVVLDSYAWGPLTWKARMKPVSGGDEFTVVIFCSDLPPLRKGAANLSLEFRVRSGTISRADGRQGRQAFSGAR